MLRNKIFSHITADENVLFFMVYSGELSQQIISALCDGLEKTLSKNSYKFSQILTVFIELSQNILKSTYTENAIIYVTQHRGASDFYVGSVNRVTKEESQKIDSKLKEIKSLTADEIKSRYKELRRTGVDSHSAGAGIGFYEIAKKAENISYVFFEEDEKLYYKIKVKVKS